MYDVALTFAGEDREYVEKVAGCLEQNGIKCFYDKNEEVNLWGKNLYDHLNDIYKNRAKYCVMFISRHYKEKLWTNHERKAAQARAFKEREEYILPVRFDNTEIPGINGTDFYIDGTKNTPEDICKKIVKKLCKDYNTNVDLTNPTYIHFTEDDIPILKRTITDLEKNKFLSEAYKNILNFFEDALSKLKGKNDHVDFNVEKYNRKFYAEIYLEGELKTKCKIWVDKSFKSYSINYLEGNTITDFSSDGAFNDYAYLEDDGKELYFKISNMSSYHNPNINKDHADPIDVARYLWSIFIKNLVN